MHSKIPKRSQENLNSKTRCILSYKFHSSWFQNLLQSYSNQNNVVHTDRHMPMGQNVEQTLAHHMLLHQSEPFDEERTVLSADADGDSGLTKAKQRNWALVIYHLQN